MAFSRSADSLFDMSRIESALASLRTEEISLISHTHGRERRGERNIQRIELQRAIKHGTKERANPGRDGSQRWRYTHEGVVYITDETSRHEVTSWRIDGKDAEDAVAPAEVQLDGRGMHAVIIIDMSGSMRNDDVPGFKTRADAVYHCLCKDFAEEQVKSGAAKDVVVTVLLMHDTAVVALNKEPLDASFIDKLKAVGRRPPRSHGNYLPALDRGLEILTEDAPNRASVLLLLLSDGAPSDHHDRECRCGVKVFDIDRHEDPLLGHRSKAKAYRCRIEVREHVKSECLERVRDIGRVFGRDKAVVCTVGFGPASEDFMVLQEMAGVLPRGSFQKLGLNAGGLRTAFSSLSSSMTELRTEGGSRALTERDKTVNKHQKILYSDQLNGVDGWCIYSDADFVKKLSWDTTRKKMVEVDLSPGATGLAFMNEPFAAGVERLVFRCTEIQVPDDKWSAWYMKPWQRNDMESMHAMRKGLRLVCKEAKDIENFVMGAEFHETFLRIQADAARLAEIFNRRVRGPAHWQVSFLPCYLYMCKDNNKQNNYPNGEAWELVEPELDGKFTKWNNNAGAVLQGRSLMLPKSAAGGSTMLGIVEEDEEEEEEIDVNDVPQAFSHFTFEASQGKQLVCDLQGTWNIEDGFVLTDPVVHYVSTSKKHKNGATDKGRDGVVKFFGTHKCNALCERLGLKKVLPADIALPGRVTSS